MTHRLTLATAFFSHCSTASSPTAGAGGELKGCSNVSLYKSPSTSSLPGSTARAHAHSSTVMWDALSSLPRSAASGRETGRVGEPVARAPPALAPNRHAVSHPADTREPFPKILLVSLFLGFAVTSLYVPLLGPLARAHACAQLRSHAGRALVPPSAACVAGCETGLVAGWRQCTVCPVHAVTSQLSHCLHMACCIALGL
jgi:hypothetical protein